MIAHLTGATAAMRATAYALTNPRPAPPASTRNQRDTASTVILSLSAAERAFRARNWNPAETPNDPCGCGRACRHAQNCPTCATGLIHFSRRPATDGEITEWIDVYVCDCDMATSIRSDQSDLPWGEVEAGRIHLFPGLATVETRPDHQAA